ncbi:MAG: hypothetical protein LBP76_01075 [Treponema sp.]|jgi:hypothetical protein|nr:hypothetical protein [Treponema sp.]
MRKTFFLVVMVIGLVMPVLAQEIAEEKKSDFFYINVPVEKVYIHQKGYVVQYRAGTIKTNMVYIPIEWFREAGGKADLINLPKGKAWPYLTIFTKAGQFSHLRLYIRRETAHESWGNIPSNVNIEDRFDVEEIKLEF